MGFNNTITVISNKADVIEHISAKLILLRDLDKVTNSPVKGALEFLKVQIPNVIITHCQSNDPDILDLIKNVREDEILRDIPVLFINDDCTRETVIDAFDTGINDILSTPIVDYELLIRTIWCIQKNEINANNETKLDFMKQLGIIQPDTGVYTQKYCEEFIKSELNNVQKYKNTACLMIITPDSKFPSYKNPKEFLDVIKKSVRLNDSIAIKDVDEFYIYLPKTKLNGVYPVFERINRNLGVDSGANAAVIEITNQKFEEIKELLQKSLIKAKEETNALIVASSAYLNDPNAGINLAKQPLIQKEEQKPASSAIAKKTEIEDTERNNKLFRQAYRQKCKIVFEPVFEKYQTYIGSKIKDTKVQYDVNIDKTKFQISKGNVRANLDITYGGLYKVKIVTSLHYCGEAKSTNTFIVDFIQLNFKKLAQILEELYLEFKNCTKLDD